MVTGLTIGRKKYAAVEDEMKALALEATALGNTLTALVAQDAASYEAVMQAYKRPKETPEQLAERARIVDEALLVAAAIPLETARACAEVTAIAERVARKGNSNCASDAGVAALLAEAACRGAVYNVRINVASLSNRSLGAKLLLDAGDLLARARASAKAATQVVEEVIAG